MQADASQGQFLSELSACMCRAQGPTQALVAASAACAARLPPLDYVALAVMARDRQTVGYHALHAARRGADRLGVLAASAAAAALAIDTKQPVHMRDLAAGQLGMDDLLYLQQEHGAAACLVLPLVIAHQGLGCLVLAASQPRAFDGHEEWLAVVAALCAPYVALLKSHQELLALEGMVSSMVPVRVALQMTADEAQRLALAGSPEAGEPASPRADDAAAAASASAAAAQPLRDSDSAELDGEELGGRRTTLLGRLRPRRRSMRPPQQQAAAAQPEAALSPQLLRSPAQSPAQQQQRAQQPQASDTRQGLSFQQPRVEAAYQAWACSCWQRQLDAAFVLLTLLSVLGGALLPALRASSRGASGGAWRASLPAPAALAGALLAAGALAALAWLRAQPAASYVRWRRPCIGVLRAARAALFCVELLQLHAHATGARVAAAAASSLLLVTGLVGQLPLPWHAALQLACALGVAGALARVQQQPGAAVLLQLLPLGVLLPVAGAALLELATRRVFLRKLL